MQGKSYPKLGVRICLVAGLLLPSSLAAQSQGARSAASSGPSAPETSEEPAEIRALADLIRGLQDQVQTLNSQLGELRMEQERASQEARELRRELDVVKVQASPAQSGPLNPYSAPTARESVAQPAPAASPAPPQSQAR